MSLFLGLALVYISEKYGGFVAFSNFVSLLIVVGHYNYSIRVERLQDISDEDCLEEGIWTRTGRWYCYDIIRRGEEYFDPYPDPREAYSVLIDHISGKGTWDSNPYVFVYDFELIR